MRLIEPKITWSYWVLFPGNSFAFIARDLIMLKPSTYNPTNKVIQGFNIIEKMTKKKNTDKIFFFFFFKYKWVRKIEKKNDLVLKTQEILYEILYSKSVKVMLGGFIKMLASSWEYGTSIYFNLLRNSVGLNGLMDSGMRSYILLCP